MDLARSLHLLLTENLVVGEPVLTLPLKPLFSYQAGVASPLTLLGHFGEVELVCESVIEFVVRLLLEILQVVLESVVAHVWLEMALGCLNLIELFLLCEFNHFDL